MSAETSTLLPFKPSVIYQLGGKLTKLLLHSQQFVWFSILKKTE